MTYRKVERHEFVHSFRSFRQNAMNSSAIRVLHCLCILCFLTSGCATPSDRYDEKSRKYLDVFSQVCYEHAHEWIKRKAGSVTTLAVSPSSQVSNKWNGDLFYSTGTPPRSWRGIPTLSESPPASSGNPGSFALRYIYVPETRTVDKEILTIHGVRMQIVDLVTNEVIAERSNYLFGGDFNRAFYCLSANWYSGNDDFANRVLGHRYIDTKTGEQLPDPKPEIYLKSTLIRTDDVSIKGVIDLPQKALPAGSTWDYDHRTITLPAGRFGMPSYWNSEPIPIAGTIEMPDYYVFILTPDGWMRSRPIRQLLFMYRKRNGDLMKSIYVQIPPGIEWGDGWGINPSEVTVTDRDITFSLLGRKKAVPYSSPTVNKGTYQRRYIYSVGIPANTLNWD